MQRQLVVGGEVLARYGAGIDDVNPRDSSGNPNFAPIGTSSGGSVIGAIPGQTRNGANFNFGYQPLNSNHHGNYPSASARPTCCQRLVTAGAGVVERWGRSWC